MNTVIIEEMREGNERKNQIKEKRSLAKKLTKRELVEVLQSEVITSLKKPIAKILKRNDTPLWIQLTRGIGFILLLSSGLFGYYLQWKVGSKQREAEIITRQAEQVQKNIDRKINWQIKLNDAMVNLKEKRSYIVIDCQNNHAVGNYEQQKLREKERYNVIRAFTGSQHVFNQEVLNKYREYISFDGSVPDVCAPNAPDEPEWRKYIIEMNDLIGKSIQEDKDTLNHLNSLKTAKQF